MVTIYAMSIAILHSRTLKGIEAIEVVVETCLSRGLPRLLIVGMAETAVRESEHRVKAAIISSGYTFPLGRIVVNLAPADIPKDTGRFDLSIALGILIASDQFVVCKSLRDFECIGELSLTGELRPVNGALPIAMACDKSGRILLCHRQCAEESSMLKTLNIYAISCLKSAVRFLSGKQKILPHTIAQKKSKRKSYSTTIDDIKGQEGAKRSMLIAASGEHNMIMMGSPGTGKTMLAHSLSQLLPLMQEKEAIETASIYSVSKNLSTVPGWQERPFRSPHHSSSLTTLIGGGQHPKPGEISLAHNGVLFLDELTEFRRNVLESLREPIESGMVYLSRVGFSCVYPSQFQLIAAMNPCPCGYLGDSEKSCGRCTKSSVMMYRRKISGPMLDRFDLQVSMNREKVDFFSKSKNIFNDYRSIVAKVRSIQLSRQGRLNSRLRLKDIGLFCVLNHKSKYVFSAICDKLRLSARASMRLLKVARTIEDINSNKDISSQSLYEAASYRELDRYAS